MNVPNFSVLLKINQSLAQIETLEAQLASLQAQLAQVQARLAAEITAEKHRLGENFKQQKLLQQIDQEIQELRRQESELARQIGQQIRSAVQAYFEGGDFGRFVRTLIEHLQAAGEPVELQAAADVSHLVAECQFQTIPSPGQIRLKVGEEKIYILDPQTVQQELQARLLVRVLGNG